MLVVLKFIVNRQWRSIGEASNPGSAYDSVNDALLISAVKNLAIKGELFTSGSLLLWLKCFNHRSIMAQEEGPILLTVNLAVSVSNPDTALPRLPSLIPHIPAATMALSLVQLVPAVMPPPPSLVMTHDTSTNVATNICRHSSTTISSCGPTHN